MDLTITNILISAGIIIVLFSLLREVNCWYWKINERIEIQRQTNCLLEKLLNEKNIKTSSNDIKITKEDLEKSDVNNPEVLQELIKKYTRNKE